jgi:hypothetical protein
VPPREKERGSPRHSYMCRRRRCVDISNVCGMWVCGVGSQSIYLGLNTSYSFFEPCHH